MRSEYLVSRISGLGQLLPFRQTHMGKSKFNKAPKTTYVPGHWLNELIFDIMG